MRTPEERRVANELCALVKRRVAEQEYIDTGYWVFSFKNEQGEWVKVDLTSEWPHTATLHVPGNSFKAFAYKHKRVFAKIYKEHKRDKHRREAAKTGEQILSRLRTEQDDVRNAAKDVKTWIS